MDLAAAGGWTARGTAKVLQDRLQLLPDDARPEWMEGLSAHRLEEVLTQVILEAVDTAASAQEYIDAQRAKGRDFDEVYGEVKPFLEYMSRPISEQMGGDRDFADAAASRDGGLVAGEQRPSQEALLKCAPHRNLVAGAPSPVTGGGGGAPRAPPSPSPSPAAAAPAEWASADLEEPLLLVGSCNGWSVEDAERIHAFSVSDAARHESVLRVEVPPGGLRFQILSSARHWNWRLHPAKKGSLRCGEDRAVPASLARGPEGDDGRDFKLKSSGGRSVVDVRVALSLAEGARIWFTEPPDGAAGEIFPGME